MPRGIYSNPSAPRGFAAMDPARRREIAAKGGASIPPHKRTFSRVPGLAALAGAKGGSAPRRPTK